MNRKKMGEFYEDNVKINFGAKQLDAVLSIPAKVTAVSTALILTHGAGGDMHFKHLVSLAHSVASSGLLCLRFTCKGLNLAYRVKAYEAVVGYLRNLEKFTLQSIFIGGRSMGARAAVALGRQLSARKEGAIQGLVCVSFPLHPPAQTHAHTQRSKDLRALSQLPVLFISGTADNMCERKLLEKVTGQMRSPSTVHWIEGASHGLTAKGRTEDAVMEEVNSHIIMWIMEHL